MNLRMKIPNKLVDTSGMFTIETVIIFWTIFFNDTCRVFAFRMGVSKSL